uniref:Uncharacterized protein n=1 Tax=Anopheles melas TaxID=34690 RepID=A0A182U575_9DIPT
MAHIFSAVHRPINCSSSRERAALSSTHEFEADLCCGGLCGQILSAISGPGILSNRSQPRTSSTYRAEGKVARVQGPWLDFHVHQCVHHGSAHRVGTRSWAGTGFATSRFSSPPPAATPAQSARSPPVRL